MAREARTELIEIIMILKRDILFLLKPDFDDTALPGPKFICPYCTFFEGMISIFPIIEDYVDIKRIDFERPRHEIVNHIGEANQSCPTLVLGEGSDRAFSTGQMGDVYFIKGQDKISAYLSNLCGVALVHP